MGQWSDNVMGDKTKYPGVRIRGKSIQLDFRYKGVRCRETLPIKPTASNLRLAADRLGQIRVEILMKTFSYSEYFPHSKKVAVFGHKEISNITITQAFDNMWDSIKPQKDKQTLKIYATHIKLHIKPGIGDIILRELRPKQVKDWIKSIDLSISSKNGILTPLRYLYSEAYSEGLVDENIMNRITNETRKRKKKNPLSIDEVDKLITHLERISQQAKHYHQFAIWTGLSSVNNLG